MGNRALIQIEDSKKRVSPVLYLHWANHIDEILRELHERMEWRRDDVGYSFARLVQIASNKLDPNGNLSIGVWNQDKKLVNDDSHGDEGCIVYNCDTGEIERFGICNDMVFDEETETYTKYYKPTQIYNISNIAID